MTHKQGLQTLEHCFRELQVKTGKTEKFMNRQQLLEGIIILDLDYEIAKETWLCTNARSPMTNIYYGWDQETEQR